VRNPTEEFGGIHGNESGFVRHADGFIVTTRGYDRVARLHRTDREFRVRHQVELTGKYSFLNSYVGRPRLFIRDGHGYLIGRNWTRPTGSSAQRGTTTSEMQLCLFRFDLETPGADLMRHSGQRGQQESDRWILCGDDVLRRGR
jgi:hypothetical protein